ncbi:GNAT family N-acetyltransferase [Pseudonocardia sp. HH130630-07]|uniref:GNAT family N-acetyltransferase n=1 Tax=Pseudonocardia sp. HH130630-07 TaxID=1690815 RepID=UPI0008151584|nr:GNAT family N-acetyltransferase [Pseudonocardia sp. HH130630-07]ANY06497.1 hypothetical protein AFB00_09570 [Pseudonocardia sp. HH130630-07]
MTPGAVVGHVGLCGDGPGSCVVTRLFVGPSGRRRGVAARLLDTVRGYAQRHGLTLTLEVAALGDGAAVALYERTGWVRTGSRTAQWKTPDGAPVLLHDYRLRDDVRPG